MDRWVATLHKDLANICGYVL